MNLDTAALAIIYAPGVTHGFVQPYVGLDEKRGRDGASIYTLKRSYRVVIWTDKKMADEERETLPEAAAAAFAAVGLAVPDLEPKEDEF